jgi:hypothetical protein
VEGSATRRIARLALVAGGGLLASGLSADPPDPTPETAVVASTTFATLVATDPSPLRAYVASGGSEIEAFELTPGRYRLTVDYEESGKQKVEGFESRDTYTPPLAGSRTRSRCAVEFEFEADVLYRVARQSLGDEGEFRRMQTDNWGVWLVVDGERRPTAQCL